MGYRTYLSKMTKEVYSNLNNKEVNQMFGDKYDPDDDNFFNLFMSKSTKLFEFGKRNLFDTKEFAPFSLIESVQNEISSENDYFIVSKDDLWMIIKSHQDHVRSIYDELCDLSKKLVTPTGGDLSPAEKFEIFNHMRSMRNWWSMDVVDKSDRETLCTTWLYEHTIFDLIRIYKSFDFENDILIFHGY